MKWFSSTLPRPSRPGIDRTPIASGSGRMILELGFWLVGIALLVAYFLTTFGLENERKQGVELFTQARAAAKVSHGLEDLPLPGQTGSLPIVPEVTHEPPSKTDIDSKSLPIAVLRISNLQLEVPVYPDLTELNLSRGAGWIGGTAAPNTGGNMAIAAHRDQYFRPLKDIALGDIIELESLSARGEYRVSRINIVDPDDVSVLEDTAVSTITLVTCYPFYFIGNAPRRYIVQAVAVDQPGRAPGSGAAPTAPPSGETP